MYFPNWRVGQRQEEEVWVKSRLEVGMDRKKSFGNSTLEAGIFFQINL